MAKKVKMSVFSDPKGAEKFINSTLNKVKSNIEGYTQGSISSIADKRLALKELNYSTLQLEKLENMLKSELSGVEMLKTTIEDGGVLEPLAHNIAITKMSASLTASAIANEIGEEDNGDWEEALEVEEPEGEALDEPAEEVEESISEEETAEVEEEVEEPAEVEEVAEEPEEVEEEVEEEEEVEVSETSHSKMHKISPEAIRSALFK